MGLTSNVGVRLSGEFCRTGEHTLGLSVGDDLREPGGEGLGVMNMPLGTGRLRSMVYGLGLAGVREIK